MSCSDRFGRAVLPALLVWGLAFGAAAGYAQTELRFPGDPVAGRRIFVERGCVRCHSIWGNGGSLGPDFALVGAGRSLQQLAGLFWNHTPRMIETVSRRGFQWPTFTEEELADIISYIYYVKLFDEPGDPELGERWFREKRCVECHSVGGRGGRIGPALDGYARYVAPLALAQGMWNKGPRMRAQQAVRGVPLPTFIGREIADIQAYIRRNSELRDRNVVFLEPPDPNNGKKLFAAKRCVRCHGRDGGGTTFGPNLKRATQRLGVAEIAGELWNHSFRMTEAMRKRGISFPRFDGNEMADVIAFLYYLRFYEKGGDVRAGEAVFARKGCANCHRGDGNPPIGPDLSRSRAALSPLSLATAMWNHAPAMYARSRMERIEWPRFEGDEMRDLAVYLKSLVHQPAPAATGERGSRVRSPGP
jgi:nitric oxide reductase subunit C